jgi:serine/threonine-protein kinase
MADAARAAITAPITRPTAMPPTEPARHNQLPTMPAAPPSPPDWTPDGAPPTDPTRSAAAQQGQPLVRTGPTQYRRATDPRSGTPVPDGSTATATGNLWKRHRVAIAAGITFLAVLAVVAAIVVPKFGDSSPGASQTPTALPDTGPFTGIFTADFGPALRSDGTPSEDAPPPYKETWRLRSVCRATGCVATAATGGQFPAKEVVFDDVGGRWLAVANGRGECKDLDSERWQMISLQPRPDGAMSGEWTNSSDLFCYSKRTVTFTRTADTDLGALADPASLPPRVVSPAEALHGRYYSEISYPAGDKQEDDYAVRTDCLRTGERCMSLFTSPDNRGWPLVFGNGKWTFNIEYDAPCPAGGTSHDRVSEVFPLPQPPQDPITLLTGHGHKESTGNCQGDDIEHKFVRTGD